MRIKTVRILSMSFASILAFAVSSLQQAWALSVDLLSGATGTPYFNQTFAETRGVEVRVPGASDLVVQSMTLKEFNLLEPVTVGARIYTSGGALLAASDALVGAGFDQSVTIPISVTLLTGQSYRVAFFVGGTGSTGDLLDVDPPLFPFDPYTETTGTFLVAGSFQRNEDLFPDIANFGAPMIEVEVSSQPPDPLVQFLRTHVITPEDLDATVPRHPLFRPRSAFSGAPPDGSGEDPHPLPRDWPPDVSDENAEHFREQWERRLPAEEYQALIDRALQIPSGTTAAVSTRAGAPVAPRAGAGLQAAGWSQIGHGVFNPVGSNQHHRAGRVRTAAFAFDNSQGKATLWLGATAGGVWKLILGQSGQNPRWVPVGDNRPGSPSVGAMLIHPANGDRILIGTGDPYRHPGSGMYRTEDGGATWFQPNVPNRPSTFQRILLAKRRLKVRIAPGRYVTFVQEYVLASGDTGIWKSLDFGKTWRQVYQGGTTDLAHDPIYDDRWYAGAPNIGILESTDYGASFHPINGNGGNGIAQPIGRVSISVCAAAPNYVYALIEGNFGALGGIYRSSDYGRNWRRIVTADRISWGQASHTCAITVDPRDPNRLFVGMGGAEWAQNAATTTDADGDGMPDVSWTPLDGGHEDFTSFLFPPPTWSNGTAVTITNDGGYYIQDYAANTLFGMGNLWGLNVEQTFLDVGGLAGAFGNQDVLLAGTQDNGMVWIDKRAAEPLRQIIGGDGGAANISPYNKSDTFFSNGLQFRRYYSSGPGTGGCFLDCGFPLGWGPMLMHSPFGPDYGRRQLFTSEDRYLWYKPFTATCDWARVNDGNPLPQAKGIKSFDIGPDGDNYVFYATQWDRDRLYVMEEDPFGPPLGALTWTDRTPVLPPGSQGTDSRVFAEKNYRGVFNNRVFYTTGWSRPARAFLSEDAGRNWRDVTGSLTTALPDAYYAELIANPFNINMLFLATDVGILRSDNGGQTWCRYMEGLPAVVFVMGIEISADFAIQLPPKLTISTNGRGWWEREIEPFYCP